MTLLNMIKMVSFLTVCAIITSTFSTTRANKCHISTSGIFLRDHVLSSFRAENIHACYETCRENTGCLSINFYRESFMCELNNRTIVQKPTKKGMSDLVVYFEKPNPGKYIFVLNFQKKKKKEGKTSRDSLTASTRYCNTNKNLIFSRSIHMNF